MGSVIQVNEYGNSKTMQVRNTLLAAGWSIDPGYEFLGIADLVYQNGRVEVECEYIQESDHLRITIYRRLVDVDVSFTVKDTLTSLLEVIVEYQDRLDEDNWDQFLRSLLAVCPDAVALTADDSGDVVETPLGLE